MLDFKDQAMNRFIQHQMLSTFKEFMGDFHKHFTKYKEPEKARANPLHVLVERMEDGYFICDHYISRAFQVSNDIFYNGYLNSNFNLYKK